MPDFEHPDVVRIDPPPGVMGASTFYHLPSGVVFLARMTCANRDCASRAKRRGRWRPGRLLALFGVGTTTRRCRRCGTTTTWRPVALRPASDERDPALA